MLTWKIWRGLKRPPTNHPVYRYVLDAPFQPTPWFINCIVIVGAPFLLLPAILFMSAVYSLRWAVSISSTIAGQQERGVFDLLALSPTGMFGVSWAIGMASIHRNDSLEQLQSPASWLVRIGFTLLTLASVGALIDPFIPAGFPSEARIVVPVVYLLTMSLAVYIDHVHSIVLGAVVGILAPTYTRNRLDAGAVALLGYLTLQVAAYTLTLLLGFSILPGLFDGLNVPASAAIVALPFLRLAVFYITREAIIALAWQTLTERLNVAASEVWFMTR